MSDVAPTWLGTKWGNTLGVENIEHADSLRLPEPADYAGGGGYGLLIGLELPVWTQFCFAASYSWSWSASTASINASHTGGTITVDTESQSMISAWEGQRFVGNSVWDGGSATQVKTITRYEADSIRQRHHGRPRWWYTAGGVETDQGLVDADTYDMRFSSFFQGNLVGSAGGFWYAGHDQFYFDQTTRLIHPAMYHSIEIDANVAGVDGDGSTVGSLILQIDAVAIATIPIKLGGGSAITAASMTINAIT